jgi:integrase
MFADVRGRLNLNKNSAIIKTAFTFVPLCSRATGTSVGIFVGIGFSRLRRCRQRPRGKIFMPLTDTAVRNAKPAQKARKLFDGGGLFLLIQPNGAKLWRLAYRFHGKQKTLSLGAYSVVSLAEAREARDAARKALAMGIDPSLQRKLEKQSAAVTFKLVAEELLDKMKREGRAPRTLTKTKWLLEFAYADFGDRAVGQITAPEILVALRRIESRGNYETARRLRSTCGMVFRYAIATARADRDPSVDLRGALTTPKVRHRAAIIEPDAIGALLRAIDGYKGYAMTTMALRLAPLVFVRPGELRHAEWTEIDFDSAEWRISAEKMKMRRPHRVPLSRQALVLLRELQAVENNSPWLFPSISSLKKPISENTLNAALRRLGFGSDEMTAHGFRAMAATRLDEMGHWRREAIDRQLAHEEEDAVRRAYTHGAEYWSERVQMMQAWADYLDELRIAGRIIPLRNDRV